MIITDVCFLVNARETAVMKKLSFLLLAIFLISSTLMICFFILNVSGNMSDLNLGCTTVTLTQEERKISADLGLIDLNSASKEQLMLLPGIGDSLSDRIIEYREMTANFTYIEDIVNVKGIGVNKFLEIRDFITVGG